MEKRRRGKGLQMGRMPLSFQLISILPWGQPDPAETTFLMLNESGA